MHMLLAEALVVYLPPLPGYDLSGRVPAQLVIAFLVGPLMPIRILPLQGGSSKDTVTRGILHVDMNIRTSHLDYDIEVDLEVVPNAFFDRKCMLLGAAPPAGKFRKYEKHRDDEHGDGPFPAARGFGHILRFGFSLRGY